MENLEPRAIVFLGLCVCWTHAARGQQLGSAGMPVDLSGTYESISTDRTLPGGLKNSGSPREVVLLPWATQQMKKVSVKDDPWRKCQPVGQFRMMAVEHNKIELAQTDQIVMMLFEDIAHGLMRTIYLARGHVLRPADDEDSNARPPRSKWLGDSIGHWDGDTLIIDSTGFNTRTWLNDAGAPHSEALHLIERIRPIRGGQFLEYKMTAEDSMALAKPYTYIRYYEKVNQEIQDDLCQDQE